MRDFSLSKEELQALRAAHRQERNKPAAYKINAVILLGSGWKLREVSEALLLDEETLRSYVEKYQRRGVEGLVHTHYMGRVARLTYKQSKQLRQALESKIYPTTAAVIEYVSKRFSIRYSASGMRDRLHGMGYSFKKPKLVPGDTDVRAQHDFVECYEKFMENKASNVEVVFIDAVHPQHNTMAGYGWSSQGAPRLLQTSSGRQRLNLHGAINIESLEMTVIESSSINRESTLQLLQMLHEKYCRAREIVVILDNARYHYSAQIKEWVEKHSRIRLAYLPTYSPQLNLIERVWKFFKKKVLYNQYYPTLKRFRAASTEFFSKIDQHHAELSSLLDGGFEGIYT